MSFSFVYVWPLSSKNICTLYCIFSRVVVEVCMAEERANIDCPVFYLPVLYIYS